MALAFSCSRDNARTPTSLTAARIKIGYFGDLSGPTFNFGQSGINGVLMAADQINQAGGINGRRIDVVISDDKGSPEEAARADGEADRSGQSRRDHRRRHVGQQPRRRAASAVVACAVDLAFVYGPGGDAGRRLHFRACFVDEFQGEVMASFAVNTLKAQKAAILFDFNSPYGRGLTNFFQTSFKRLGGRIVNEQSYTQGDADFKGQLSSIRAAEPDVIYIPGYYGDVTLIAKQARQLGLTQPLLGGDGWDAPELWQLGGDALNGSYISTHYSVDDPSPTIQSFVDEYMRRYGNLTPDAHAALAYDAARILFDAITRAGSTEGANCATRSRKRKTSTA